MGKKRWWHRRAPQPSTLDVSLLRAWTEKPTQAHTLLVTGATPQVLKTRIAREVVVAVLEQAARQMTTSEIVQRASVDPKVQAAGISRSTLKTQLSTAIHERPARIVRICRGMYASAAVVEAAEAAAPNVVSLRGKRAAG